MKKAVLYIPQELFRRFKAKLALEGLSMSEWFRREVKRYVDKE